MYLQAIQNAGYAVVPNVLSVADLKLWREVVGRFSTAVARNLLVDIRIYELANAPAVRQIVEPILGSEARLVRGLLFDKRPGDNWAVAWHQDTVIPVAQRPADPPPGYTAWTEKQGVPHVRPPASVLEQMLAVRLCLDDNTLDNGVLNVVPGSHRDGFLDQPQVEQYRDRNTFQPCVAHAGDAVLMRPLLLHASSKATSPKARRVVHFEFAAQSLPKPLAWPHWQVEGV